MKPYHRWIAFLTLTAMIATSTEDGHAKEYYTDSGGYAYEEAYQSCCLGPALVLALVAIAGIIAVGVHNRSSSNHNHVHSD